MISEIACVMRSGGRYAPAHVAALAAGLQRHWPGPYRLRCLTDQAMLVPGVENVMLRNEWPGWWAKIELFRPNFIAAPTLYLDLDCVIVGDLAPLAACDGSAAILRDVYRPNGYQSSVMVLTPEWCRAYGGLAYNLMGRKPERTIRAFDPGGDQALIEAVAPKSMSILQDQLPGQLVSWKADCDQRWPLPPDARLVFFHGEPKIEALPAASPLRRIWSGEHGLFQG